MMDALAAQDPGELFDVVTADGQPTGRVKTRAEVHRDGDWHRAVHVWVAGIDADGPFLLFQRRSLLKDTQPGKLDATVGGHYRAGESLAETLREVEEEIGIAPDPAELRPVGLRRAVHEGGVIDREIQDVFLLRDDRPLTGYRPHPAELAALVRASLDPLLDFLSGDAARCPATAIRPGSREIEPIALIDGDLVPRLDRYEYRVAIAARGFLYGERHIAV